MSSRAYMQSEEFKARQYCFDFGIVARAVLELGIVWRRQATEWLRQWCHRPTNQADNLSPKYQYDYLEELWLSKRLT